VPRRYSPGEGTNVKTKESNYPWGFIDGLLWAAEHPDVIADLKRRPVPEGRAKEITEKLEKQAVSGGFILPNSELDAK
jgi:hypothetical protein